MIFADLNVLVVTHILEYFQHNVNEILKSFRRKEGKSMYSRVKELCRKCGISVRELEKSLGFSSGSVCKWDEHIPTATKIKDVADYFGITIDELMKGNEEA